MYHFYSTFVLLFSKCKPTTLIHLFTTFMPLVYHFYSTYVNSYLSISISKKYENTSCLKIRVFFIYRQYRWHRFLSNISANFRKIWKGPNGIFRGPGKMMHEKNLRPKISFRLPFRGTGGCVQLCIFHSKDKTNFVSLCLQKPLRRSLEPRRKSSKASPSCSWCAPFDKPQPSQTTSSGK